MKRQFVPKFETQFNIKFFKETKANPTVLDIQKAVGRGGNLVILLASSGVGRDTVLENCLKLIKNAERLKRITSRKIRTPKIEKERMIFIKKSNFLDQFEKEEIVLAGYYRANKELYGVLKSELLKLKNKNKIYFFECTINALSLKKLFPKSKLIFFLPPSIEELKKHFLTRGDTDWQNRFRISCSEIKVALTNMKEIFKTGFVDLALINSDSEETARKIKKALKSKKYVDQLWRDFFKKIKSYEKPK